MIDSVDMSIDVSILGQSIRIKHQDEAYIRRVENYINEQLDTLQKQQRVPSLQLSARLLLIIADELFCVRKERDGLQQLVEERVRRILNLIDDKACMV